MCDEPGKKLNQGLHKRRQNEIHEKKTTKKEKKKVKFAKYTGLIYDYLTKELKIKEGNKEEDMGVWALERTKKTKSKTINETNREEL